MGWYARDVMSWYAEHRGHESPHDDGLDGGHGFVAGFRFNGLAVLKYGEVVPKLDAVVELVAGELDAAAHVVALEEADEMGRGELGIVELIEDALDGEVTGLVVEALDFLGGGWWRGRRGILFPAPAQDLGNEEAVDGHARGLDAVAGAEVGAFLPAVAGVGRRVVEEEEEFVEQLDGLARGVPVVLQPVQKRSEAGNFRWLGFGCGI
jgi:hypothetical protein